MINKIETTTIARDKQEEKTNKENVVIIIP
jgi:hypothetical protein